MSTQRFPRVATSLSFIPQLLSFQSLSVAKGTEAVEADKGLGKGFWIWIWTALGREKGKIRLGFRRHDKGTELGAWW